MDTVIDYSTKSIVESSDWGCDGGVDIYQITYHSYLNINNRFNLLIKNRTFLSSVRNGVDIGAPHDTKVGDTFPTFIIYNNDKYIVVGETFDDDSVVYQIRDITNMHFEFKEHFTFDYPEMNASDNSSNNLKNFIQKILDITGFENVDQMLLSIKLDFHTEKYLECMFSFYDLLLETNDLWGEKYPNYNLYNEMLKSHPDPFYVKPKFKYDMEHWCKSMEDSYGDVEWTLKDETWYNYFKDNTGVCFEKRVMLGIIRI